MVLKVVAKYILLICCLLWAASLQAQNINSDKIASTNQLMRRAIKEFKTTYPRLEKLFDKGIAYQEQKDFSRANDCFSEFLSLLKGHLQVVYTLLSYEDQQTYVQEYMSWVEHIKHSGVFYAKSDPAWGDLVYDCELFTKSLSLESTNRLKFAVLKSGDEKLINLWKVYEEMMSIYSTYKSYAAILEADSTYLAAKKAFDQGIDHPLTDYIRRAEKSTQALTEIKDAIRSTEEDLNQMIAVSHDPQINFTTSWIDIRNALSDKQAAIEFISHSFGNTPQRVHYTAIVTRSDSKHPRIIHLMDETKLSRLIGKEPQDFDSLYHKIWQPIEENFHGINEVFISVSGMMSGVSFAALRHDGQYLSDCGIIRNVVSTKDIINLNTRPDKSLPDHGSAIFFGGADFGVLPDTSSLINKTRGQGFDYLPASKEEVRYTSMALKDKGWEVSLFTDQSASEEMLKKSLSANSPSVLHIATHGFKLPAPDGEVSDMKMSDIGSVDRALFRFSDNPLIRCGLLLSGANHVWQGKEAIEGIDDGIVTGMDISQFNLLDCELVIISACYTALGQIDHSEGVYGLQRALRIAGARKMILSLWNIPDKESAEFFRMLYSSLTTDITIGEAFRVNQLVMRTLYPNDPHKWAGFVLVE